jgi:hypothetical protein
VSKSSVYKAYVDMCRREGRPTLLTRDVVGKMVKRAFPDVRTKRRGPRGRVTQYYVGLRCFIPTSDPRPVQDVDHCGDTTTMPPVKGEEEGEELDRDPGSSGSGDWSVANAYPQQPHTADWKHHLTALERQWDSTFTSGTPMDGWMSAATMSPFPQHGVAGDDGDLDRLLAWADTMVAQDEEGLLLLAHVVCPVHDPSW